MIITWYGQSCFKIQSGSASLVFDPFKKSIGLTLPKIEAQLVLVSHNHPDHNNTAAIKGDPFIINSPGEYELKRIRVRGINSYHDAVDGKERGLNIIYTVKMEDINLAHFGDLGQTQLTEKQLDAIGIIDILMIPVGGVYTINSDQAVNVINQIEPRIVIPMHYKIKGLKPKLDAVTNFLKELGEAGLRAEDKLVLKKKNLPTPEEKMKIVLLKT